MERSIYTFLEVNVTDIEPPPVEKLDLEEVKRLVQVMEALANGQTVSAADQAAIVLWDNGEGKLVALDGPEKLGAFLECGATRMSAYVVHCRTDKAIELAQEFRHRRKPADGQHRSRV